MALPLSSVSDHLYVWTVGTTDDGERIQQVEWTYAEKELVTTNFPVWAGSILVIVEETGSVTKIKCSISNVPNWKAWGLKALDDGLVEGWIQTKKLVHVRLEDLKTGQ